MTIFQGGKFFLEVDLWNRGYHHNSRWHSSKILEIEMMKSVLSFVCVGLAFALTACNSSSDSGLGTGAACTANSECASNICAKSGPGYVCAPAGTGCMPACASNESCVASTQGPRCLETAQVASNQPSNGGEEGQGGAPAEDTTMQGGDSSSDTTNPGMGGATGGDDESDAPCQPAIDCLNNCGPGDQTCVNNCLQDGSEAAELYNAWGSCANNSGCVNLDGSLDFECAFGECGAELTACFGFEVPMGTNTCEEFLSCINDCPPMGEACQEECVDQTSARGFGAYQAFIICADDAGCLDLMDPAQQNACFEQSCATEAAKCLPPRAMPMGDGDCIALTNCVTDCDENNSDCARACIEASSQEGFDDRIAFEECIQGATQCANETEPAAQRECIQMACTTEIQACFEGGMLPDPAAMDTTGMGGDDTGMGGDDTGMGGDDAGMGGMGGM